MILREKPAVPHQSPFCALIIEKYAIKVKRGASSLQECAVFLCPNLREYIYVAATNFIVYMAADAEGMQSAAFWTMGSLADAKWHSLFLPVLIVTALAVYFLSQLRTLDVLLLGEELAVTLGIDASAKRRLYMGLLALLTGVLVATCGIIGFVGLVVPHLVRAFTGASHRRLLPAALLVGAIFLVVADLLARTLLPAGDLPIGIITALIGAPLFMKLLFGSSGNFGGGR